MASAALPRPRSRRASRSAPGDGSLDWPKIGKRVRDVREALGQSAGDLAAILGVSRGWLSDVEQGNKRLDHHELEWLAQMLEVPLAYLVRGHASTKRADEKRVAALIGQLRKTLLLYGAPALERAERLVTQFDDFTVLDHEMRDRRASAPINEILDRWARAAVVERENGRRRLAILPLTAHQLYATLLRSATQGDEVRCTSAVRPDWWTKYDEGKDYHDLNVWKAGQENVQIRRLLILQSEKFRIRESSRGHPEIQEFISEIIRPQQMAGISLHQILWGAVPEGARKDMMIINRSCTAWSDLARVGEPKVVHVSDVEAYVEESIETFDRIWDLAEEIPDLQESDTM